MPEPGALIEAFSPLPDRSFRMDAVPATQSHPLPRGASVEGRLEGLLGAQGWYIEACREHAPKVTGGASEGY